MNKSMKPSAAAQRPLTEEEKKEQMMRAFMQKKASIAEGVLFNLMQNPSLETICPQKSPATFANEVAEDFMEIVYGHKMVAKEEKPAE